MRGRTGLVAAAVWLSLAVGVSFLGFRAYHGVQVARYLTSPREISAGRVASRTYECLDDAFRAMVPVGAKVYIDIGGLTGLAALAPAFPDRQVVGRPQDADVVFALGDPTQLHTCGPDAFRSLPPAPAR